MFARFLEYKAPGRVEKVNPAYTSQRCSQCGHVDADSRKSQALYVCTSCGYSCNADLNAATNIAAGHAARGDQAVARSLNREPQLALLAS
jgi:putative transposase